MLCLFLLSCIATAAHTSMDNLDRRKGSNWAVLVAGSNSYFNYRHQADVAHAHYILTTFGGYPKDKVIVMMYNDIVNSSSNPFPGQLFNEPGGQDVYNNMTVSYSGEQVTATTFLNVLQGIKQGDTLEGPVLQSGPKDNVFIYYSDHGGVGLVGMPTSDPLYADDLQNALQYMHKHRMYSQLVFYLEACESGSMFDGILSNKTSIFATTASTPYQPSYAVYWNNTLSAYMADEYSIRWMQDTTRSFNFSDASNESLITQYNHTFSTVLQSNPQQYGDTSFDDEPIDLFEAYERTELQLSIKEKLQILHQSIDRKKYSYSQESLAESVSSRDVKLAVLQQRYSLEKNAKRKAVAAQLVAAEIEARKNVDVLFDTLIVRIVTYSNQMWDESDMIDVLKHGYITPSNYTCLKHIYTTYEFYCQPFNAYSLQYVRLLVNLCEIYVDQHTIEQHLRHTCVNLLK